MQGEYEGDVVKLVTVKLSKVRASSFSPINSQIVLEIFFNDGTEKQIFRTTTISKPEQVAAEVLQDIIRMEENINVEFDGDSFVNEPRVLIKDYEQVQEKLADFFKGLYTKMAKVRGSNRADGYLDLVRAVNRTELNFNESQ